METTKGFNGKALYQPKGKAKEYSDWAVNFYTGCSNDCDYCYCKLGVLSHTWSDKPKLKKCFISERHALEVFNRELERVHDNIGNQPILFSFTTDPLLPETRELTFQAMESAIENGIPVKILTKRADWITAFMTRVAIQSILYSNNRHLIAFGFTLTGCDENEPHASTNEERINAMRCLYLLGYKTFASIEQIIDPKKSLEIIKETQGFCGLYKVGTISGVRAGYAPRDMRNLMDYMVEKSREGQKIYLKDSFINWMRLERENLPGRFVNANYNIFTAENPQQQ